MGAALILNGVATAAAGVGQVVNSATNTNYLPEENIFRTAAKAIGNAIAGDSGGKVGAAVYDGANMAADIYSIGSGASAVAKAAIETSKGIDSIISMEKATFSVSGNPGRAFMDTYLVKYRLGTSMFEAQKYITVSKPWLRVANGIGFVSDRANNLQQFISIFDQ